MNIKGYFTAFGYSLLVGIFAGIIARWVVFPIVGLLHNRWIDVISHDTSHLIYFWIGQIVGTLAFIFFMYINLRKQDWPTLSSVFAVIISLVFLFILGIILSSVLNYA
jgi:uncharacterized protein YacL